MSCQYTDVLALLTYNYFFVNAGRTGHSFIKLVNNWFCEHGLTMLKSEHDSIQVAKAVSPRHVHLVCATGKQSVTFIEKRHPRDGEQKGPYVLKESVIVNN